MKTAYEQIVNVNNIASLEGRNNISEIIAFGQNENLSPATEDKTKTLLLAIDLQNDFIEGGGSLQVPGSKGDIERLTSWIYRNVANITQIMCSLDSHSITQIFHPSWWVGASGNQPEPFTIISYNDVKSGRWNVSNGETERTLEYLSNLESAEKKQLCVWPYHCLEGTYGTQLEREFSNMLYFHSATRKSTPILVSKGENPYSEMYGIIKAEYDPNNYVNTAVLDTIEQFDKIYIAGEASSHCVLASVIQILEHFADQPEITKRIVLLEDCMSPIFGFEEVTKKSFEVLKHQYGIQIMKSTDVALG